MHSLVTQIYIIDTPYIPCNIILLKEAIYM